MEFEFNTRLIRYYWGSNWKSLGLYIVRKYQIIHIKIIIRYWCSLKSHRGKTKSCVRTEHVHNNMHVCLYLWKDILKRLRGHTTTTTTWTALEHFRSIFWREHYIDQLRIIIMIIFESQHWIYFKQTRAEHGFIQIKGAYGNSTTFSLLPPLFPFINSCICRTIRVYRTNN